MDEYLEKVFPIIDKCLSDEIKKKTIPNLFVNVSYKEKTIFSNSFECSKEYEIDKDQSDKYLFRCASITKSFTCFMMLQLRDQNKLSLEDPITKHLPEFSKIKFINPDSKPPTLRQLAGHCSGLPKEGNFDRWLGVEMPKKSEIFENLCEEMINKPLEKYHYSNIGFILLGFALEKIAEIPYQKYVEEFILKPLQMEDSTFEYDLEKNKEFEINGYLANGEKAPKCGYGDCKSCGGLLTSINDLKKYTNFLMKPNNNKILHEDSVRELFAPTILISPSKEKKLVTNYAYGLGFLLGYLDDEFKFYSHGGGTWGFTSWMQFFPDLELMIFIWYNSEKRGFFHYTVNLFYWDK